MTAIIPRPRRGFTIIEMLIVVAIIAILLTIAVPSYRLYVIRGHRSAAISEMMSLANREQQLLISNRSYATKADLVAAGYQLPAEVLQFYDYDVTAPAPAPRPTFLITFTPTGAQASDGPLTLDQNGTKLPANKWGGH
jgi:type IV pilus assembly protein PilE